MLEHPFTPKEILITSKNSPERLLRWVHFCADDADSTGRP